MAGEQTGSILASLSNELAATVERASQFVVTVEARRRNAASGIVWPAGNGVIVTADHVIEREEDINVILPGGQKVGATLAGRDPGSDLAVLRLAGTAAAPSPATLAPADAVKIGHLVLALGRPGEGTPMATFGIVSAVGGQWRTARGGIVEGYVRADVALYPGFSGGPLVDTQGRVVGLNSWYLARGQELALPSATVSSVVQTLLTQGKVSRGYLGLSSQPVALPANLRQKLGLQQETGLVVVGVEPGSPAEQAGVILGDVLLALAGRAIADAEDLQAILATGLVGKPTPLAILRGGERKELTVTPGERT